MLTSGPDISLLRQLAANSAPYRDPLLHLPWEALSLDEFWLPPHALSLSGDALFEQQAVSVQRRLSQLEFINFIHAGLWLESLFISRVSQDLIHNRNTAEYAYNLHEIREEAGHSLMFLRLIERSGLNLPQRCTRPPWFADCIGRCAPTRSILFQLAVVLGEDIPDRLNRRLRSETSAMNPLIREMCRLHIIDEARHIARARNVLEAHLASSSALTRRLLRPLLSRLLKQFVRRFYYPRAEVYELAGLTPGKTWRARARANPQRKEFIEHMLQPTLHLLTRLKMPVSKPF